MDPTANLLEQRAIAARIIAAWDACEGTMLAPDVAQTVAADADRLAHLVQALDTWIAHGGFLPNTWRNVPAVAL